MKILVFNLYLSFFIFTIVTAQHHSNIVFEGAGIRGIAYVGALKYLEENELLNNIEKVGGTSAGAIAALAVSLGYDSHDIEKLIYDTKFQKFNDGKFLFIGGIARLNRNYGWYRGKAFIKWLEELIRAKTGDADITFQEMHEAKFKDLYVTGTSLNRQRLLVFSFESYPHMRVKDAVRISMSIPLYFEAVLIDSAGHPRDKKDLPEHYDLMVDGGFTGNFPVFIFDSLLTHEGRIKRIPNVNTIGFRIDSPEQIRYDSLGKGLAAIPIARFKNYLGAFYNYVIENLNRESLTPDDWLRTVSISSGSIGPKIRKLSIAEKNLLITNGYTAAKRYMKCISTNIE
jgi:NTE family protein